jgi:putative restriction endonuclease
MVDVSPSQFWREALGSLHIWKDGSSRAVHKPLLSLLVIARAAARAENRFRFKELDAPLTSLLQEFGPPRKACRPSATMGHI